MYCEQGYLDLPVPADIISNSTHTFDHGYQLMADILFEAFRQANKRGFLQPPEKNGVPDDGELERINEQLLFEPHYPKLNKDTDKPEKCVDAIEKDIADTKAQTVGNVNAGSTANTTTVNIADTKTGDATGSTAITTDTKAGTVVGITATTTVDTKIETVADVEVLPKVNTIVGTNVGATVVDKQAIETMGTTTNTEVATKPILGNTATCPLEIKTENVV
ncbi:hypothetical protein F5B22DRAFT_645744 [Xylaria bambusicola]|uniref:uncharacterized protein n=1 Tax=Xylaria bambusicola TaxID=326684 RepID=UPI0020088948|nr:uncharacterized protein F5B22DRAFT_645744 [Xylaria bambusicola]KAI0517562.1 hypothetical protein F5B22DRAFT_645744 [Xylaria bambusicola]